MVIGHLAGLYLALLEMPCPDRLYNSLRVGEPVFADDDAGYDEVAALAVKVKGVVAGFIGEGEDGMSII